MVTPRLDKNSPRVLIIDHTAVLKSVRFKYSELYERTGWDITLLIPKVGFENGRVTPFEPLPAEKVRIVLGKISWIGHEIQSIYLTGIVKAFRASRPDIVVLMIDAFSLYALQTVLMRALFAPKSKLVFQSTWNLDFSKLHFRPRWLFPRILKTVLKRSTSGFCVTDTATHFLKQAHFPNARTLFHGVSEHVFAPHDLVQSRILLEIDLEAKLFLFVGRMLEEKGIDIFIRAVSELADARPAEKISVLIVGDGPHLEELRRVASSMSTACEIRFLPSIPIESVPLYMNACTALVLPSLSRWNEQFGRVNAEAMLCGATIIGSTSGSIPEVLGECGFIFQADSHTALRECMEEVLDNPSEVKRRKILGRKRALEHYSTYSFNTGLIELVNQLEGDSGKILERET